MSGVRPDSSRSESDISPTVTSASEHVIMEDQSVWSDPFLAVGNVESLWAQSARTGRKTTKNTTKIHFCTFSHLVVNPISHTKPLEKKIGPFFGHFCIGGRSLGHFGPKSAQIGPKNHKKYHKNTFFAPFLTWLSILYHIQNFWEQFFSTIFGPISGIFGGSFWGATLAVTLTSGPKKYKIPI